MYLVQQPEVHVRVLDKHNVKPLCLHKTALAKKIPIWVYNSYVLWVSILCTFMCIYIAYGGESTYSHMCVYMQNPSLPDCRLLVAILLSDDIGARHIAAFDDVIQLTRLHCKQRSLSMTVTILLTVFVIQTNADGSTV